VTLSDHETTIVLWENNMQLADQVAIITGAARGIGRATARCLAEEGSSIVVADINEAGAQEAAAEIESLGRRAMAVQTDVADYDQVQHMVQRAIETFGQIDILVNNAGNAALTPLLDTTPAVWDRTIKIHLYGTFFCTQAVVRHMVTRGRGRIVNISSVSGLVGSAGRAAYGAAKGGLVTLTRVLAVELAPQGIRVNAIAPGAVETELSRGAWTPADREGYFRLTPVERLGQPEDIAHAVRFLCLPQSDYITGQVLAVDGGFSVAGIQWK
jgi:NAD(P)-dependent dehydrogenase (short-subunit alcohol dehydrogenase family)